MQFTSGWIADYFQNWKLNGDEVSTGSDAVGATVENVLLPIDGADETRLSFSRGEFVGSCNQDGSWQVGTTFPVGEVSVDSDLTLSGMMKFNSADYPSLCGTSRFGTIRWAASVATSAIELGCKVGPMSSVFTLPWGSRTEPATNEITTVFPFEESELTVSLKSTTAGEEAAFYASYMKDGFAVALEKMMGEPTFTAAAIKELNEDIDVGVAVTGEGGDFRLTARAQASFADLAPVPISVKGGVDTDARLGAGLSVLLGSRELMVAVEKLRGQKPTFGFSIAL